MRRRQATALRPLAALLATALAGAGCASAPAKVPVVGRTVTVRMTEGDTRLKGELLFVDKDSLWLRGEDGVREVRLSGVRTVRVKQHSLDGKKAPTMRSVPPGPSRGLPSSNTKPPATSQVLWWMPLAKRSAPSDVSLKSTATTMVDRADMIASCKIPSCSMQIAYQGVSREGIVQRHGCCSVGSRRDRSRPRR